MSGSATPNMTTVYEPGFKALVAFADKAAALLEELGMFAADQGTDRWPPELEEAYVEASEAHIKLQRVKQPEAGASK